MPKQYPCTAASPPVFFLHAPLGSPQTHVYCGLPLSRKREGRRNVRNVRSFYQQLFPGKGKKCRHVRGARALKGDLHPLTGKKYFGAIAIGFAVLAGKLIQLLVRAVDVMMKQCQTFHVIAGGQSDGIFDR